MTKKKTLGEKIVSLWRKSVKKQDERYKNIDNSARNRFEYGAVS